jgi:hypothetical protein
LFSNARLRARTVALAAAISVSVAAGVGGAYLGGQALAGGASGRSGVRVIVPIVGLRDVALQHSAASQGGPPTPAARGLLHSAAFQPSSPFQFPDVSGSQRDLDCLTAAVYYEARGEAVAGQAAVAQVVLNRVRHPAFPKTVCGVVYQGVGSGTCQFSFACDGSADRQREAAAWTRARRIAQQALDGYVMAGVGHATHFHLVTLSVPWGGQMVRVAQVGQHVFYAFGGHRIFSPSRAVAVSAPDAPPPGPSADSGALQVVATPASLTPAPIKPAAEVSAASPAAQSTTTTPS